MGYDVEPLVTLETKRRIFRQAEDEDWLMIFEHDATTAWGRIQHDGRAYQLRTEGKRGGNRYPLADDRFQISENYPVFSLQFRKSVIGDRPAGIGYRPLRCCPTVRSRLLLVSYKTTSRQPGRAASPSGPRTERGVL